MSYVYVCRKILCDIYWNVDERKSVLELNLLVFIDILLARGVFVCRYVYLASKTPFETRGVEKIEKEEKFREKIFLIEKSGKKHKVKKVKNGKNVASA
jgi:hypothetical protein